MQQMLKISLVVAGVLLASACAPKVGSEAWCKKMDAKDKGDWSMNEAADYAKHCILRAGSDDE